MSSPHWTRSRHRAGSSRHPADPRCPHDGASEYLPEVVEEWIAAMFGGLDDLGVEVGRDREAVWPGDPCVAGRRRRVRLRRDICSRLAESDRVVTVASSCGKPAARSRGTPAVLGQGQTTRRGIQGGNRGRARPVRRRRAHGGRAQRTRTSTRATPPAGTRSAPGRTRDGKERDRGSSPMVPAHGPRSRRSLRAARCALSLGFTSASIASQATAVIGARCRSR